MCSLFDVYFVHDRRQSFCVYLDPIQPLFKNGTPVYENIIALLH